MKGYKHLVEIHLASGNLLSLLLKKTLKPLRNTMKTVKKHTLPAPTHLSSLIPLALLLTNLLNIRPPHPFSCTQHHSLNRNVFSLSLPLDRKSVV